MSHHIPISLDSNMAESQSDTSPTIYLNNENDAETFGICEKREGDCSKHCLENGAPYEMGYSTGSDAENKQIIPNSKCIDGFKIESLVRDSDKNAKSFHKCNGVLHSDHSSGDNSYVINLNACTEELLPLVEGCNSHSQCDSLSATATDRHCRQSDYNVDLPLEDLHLTDHNRHSNMHSCQASSKDNHAEIDVLLTEIEKTSLCGTTSHAKAESCVITYEVYESEKQMPDIMRLITKDLSEPYSIYTYRYFIHNWPKLCFLAIANNVCVGAIVCKLDLHKKMVRRGYIAMLAVDSEYRRRQIGSSLVTKAIEAMIRDDCDEVVLETEITNQAALHLYENLGFVRDKRLFRYYLNGVDALRLKLWLR